MHIQPVHPDYVCQSWAQVAPFLGAALKHSAGEYNLDQLKVMLTTGTQALLVTTDGERVTGAITVAFENYPNDRIAFVTAVGGRLITSDDLWEQFLAWCRNMGATKIRGAAHKSVARLWRQRFAVEPKYILVEKTL